MGNWQKDCRRRAEHSKEIVKNLSKEFTEEFGKGFSRRTLWEIRKLYVYFSDYEKVRTLFTKLISNSNPHLNNEIITNFFIKSSINNSSEHFSALAKLFEHSEFFVSAEKCRRLAIGCRICGNEQSYENKNEKIFINQNI